jgi:hypothetical protein
LSVVLLPSQTTESHEPDSHALGAMMTILGDR